MKNSSIQYTNLISERTVMILTALTNGIDTNKIFPKQAVKTLQIKSFSVLVKFFYLAVQRDEFSLQQTVKTHTDKMSKE